MEYKIIEACDKSNFERQLNDLSTQGWEVVAFSHAIDPGSQFPMSYAALLGRYQMRVEAAQHRVEPFEVDVPESRLQLVLDAQPLGLIRSLAAFAEITGVKVPKALVKKAQDWDAEIAQLAKAVAVETKKAGAK